MIPFKPSLGLNLSGIIGIIKGTNTVSLLSFKNKLSFYNPNIKKFPSIKILGFNKALDETGFILINVLNEILVQRFLNNKILFTDIVYKLLTILNSKAVKNYLKKNKIRHINDVFNAYNFCRSLVN
jgi:1-deoxy-D-xylulose 5-phosphate reductoisomerase